MEEKEEKKAKKKKHSWYSPASVKLRKLLCMLAFCGFMAGLYFYLMGVLDFGYEVFDKNNFFKTSSYHASLVSDINTLIYQTEIMKDNEDVERGFSVYDVGHNKLYTYAPGILNNSFFSENQSFSKLYTLNAWIISEKDIHYDMWDLSSAKKFLESNDADRCYLYFSKNAFKDLFKYGGVENENKRLSADLSEKAYMVFLDEEGLLEEQGFNFDNCDADSIFKYDLSGISYAAYDPKQDVYYSSWDDYFGPYDQYIYDCEYLRNVVGAEDYKSLGVSMEADGSSNIDVTWYEENDEENMGGSTLIEASLTNSFIFALLRAENLNDGMTVKNRILEKKQQYQIAREYLKNLKDSGFVYYMELGNKIYKNVDIKDASDFVGFFDYGYILNSQEEYGGNEYLLQQQTEYGEDSGFQPITFAGLPENLTLYVGIALGREYTENLQIFREYEKWEQMNRYILPFSILAAVCLVIMIILAISLLSSTGQREKGDDRIILKRIDSLPFEVWSVMFGILIIGFAFMNLLIVDANESLPFGKTPEFALLFGGSCLPFGISFMEFCLSFARRSKAKNLFSNLLITRPFRKDGEKNERVSKLGRLIRNMATGIKEKYRGFRFKLVLWLVVFTILECFPIMIMVESAGDDIFIFGLIIALCLILLACWLLYNVEKNIGILSDTVKEITKGNLDTKCEIEDTLQLFEDLDDGINHIGDGLKTAVETSLKDERMKTELITNVSHDLKTPLTSIINYIDLLKQQEIPGNDAKHYIEVLEAKAQRLKQLTEDLVEAAKATSGNIELEMIPLTFDELMKQALGEFEDKYKTRNLTLIACYPENPVVILADGRRLYRVIENILQNAYKYAMEGTRIYAELSNDNGTITFILKNVSTSPLNISPEELMERFTRGDSSRTTEGSGLGLSIAKDLTKLMDGTFEILLDGDLFKAVVTFPEYRRQDENGDE